MKWRKIPWSVPWSLVVIARGTEVLVPYSVLNNSSPQTVYWTYTPYIIYMHTYPTYISVLSFEVPLLPPGDMNSHPDRLHQTKYRNGASTLRSLLLLVLLVLAVVSVQSTNLSTIALKLNRYEKPLPLLLLSHPPKNPQKKPQKFYFTNPPSLLCRAPET